MTDHDDYIDSSVIIPTGKSEVAALLIRCRQLEVERTHLAAALKNLLTLSHRRDGAEWTVLETRAGQNAVRLLERLGLYEDDPR